MSWKKQYQDFISSDDLSRLESFIGLVDELQQRRFFKATSVGYMVDVKVNAPVEHISDHGDLEDFRSAILSIRKLISDKEPTFINRIIGILCRFESSPDRVELLKKSHQEIKKARKELADVSLGQESPNGELSISTGRSRETLLRQIINTQLFHGDNTPEAPVPDMTEGTFSDNVLNDIVLRQAVIELVLDEYEFACWLKGFIINGNE